MSCIKNSLNSATIVAIISPNFIQAKLGFNEDEETNTVAEFPMSIRSKTKIYLRRNSA